MKNYLYTFWPRTQKNQGIYRPVVGVLAPSVSPVQPLILPFVGQNKPLANHGNCGFTLLELMTALVVAATLIAIAVPSMSSFIQNNRIVTQTNDLVADLNFARSEAVKRSTTIGICKSSDATTCNTAGNNWAIGRIIFVDLNANGVVDAGESILRVREKLDGGNTLNAGGNLAGNLTTNFLVFTKTGITNLTIVPTNLRANEFALCDQRGSVQGRSIKLEITGRATIAKPPQDCSPP